MNAPHVASAIAVLLSGFAACSSNIVAGSGGQGTGASSSSSGASGGGPGGSSSSTSSGASGSGTGGGASSSSSSGAPSGCTGTCSGVLQKGGVPCQTVFNLDPVKGCGCPAQSPCYAECAGDPICTEAFHPPSTACTGCLSMTCGDAYVACASQ